MLLATVLIRVALSFAAGHSADVTRTSANHYQIGALDVVTRDCTQSASDRDGERARLAIVGSRAFLRFRDHSGEADGECQVASARERQPRDGSRGAVDGYYMAM